MRQKISSFLWMFYQNGENANIMKYDDIYRMLKEKNKLKLANNFYDEIFDAGQKKLDKKEYQKLIQSIEKKYTDEIEKILDYNLNSSIM